MAGGSDKERPVLGTVDPNTHRYGPLQPEYVPPPPTRIGPYLLTPFGWRRVDGWQRGTNPFGTYREDAALDYLTRRRALDQQLGLQVGEARAVFDAQWRLSRRAANAAPSNWDAVPDGRRRIPTVPNFLWAA